jgi:HEAT repeat protein
LKVVCESDIREKTVQRLITSLQGEADVVRCLSARALARIRVREAVKLLTGSLADSAPDVR